jgi:ribosomal protein S4
MEKRRKDIKKFKLFKDLRINLFNNISKYKKYNLVTKKKKIQKMNNKKKVIKNKINHLNESQYIDLLSNLFMYHYGIKSKAYLKRYFRTKNSHPLHFFFTLETRFEVILYRIFYTTSFKHSQQLIQLGAFLRNNNYIKVPKKRVLTKDIITVESKYQPYIYYLILKQNFFKKKQGLNNSNFEYIEVDYQTLSFYLFTKPHRNQIPGVY